MRVLGLLSTAGVAHGLLLSADKNRPVTKVITLLKDMQKQLANEGEEDEKIFNKMQCWCTENDKAKTKSIADAEAKLGQLTASIEEGTAKSAQLTTEIANLEKEVAANQESLGKATALRQKQLAEFNEEEKDMLQTIAALKSAITVLSKHHPNSSMLLQTDSEQVLPNVAVLLKHVTSKYSDMLTESMTPSDKKVIGEFVQNVPQYANQSGEIFGVLRNMLDTFEANLKASQEEEKTNQAAYEELKAAKEAEIEAGQEQIDTKTVELGDTDEKLANDKVEKEDTEASMAADEKFLADLKEKCKQTDQEYEQRQKTRTEEIAAVGEALKFLSSDDAHDLFSSTFNPASFMQVNMRAAAMKAHAIRDRAAGVLVAAGKRANNPKLSALATKVKLDAFTKVKAAIDEMVADLIKQKDDDIKKRDFCIDAQNENKANIAKTERDIADDDAAIQAHKQAEKNLTQEIDTLKEEIANMEVEMKRAGEDRELENAEFQKTVQDQRATVKLLNGAMNALKGFYEKKTRAVALNQQEPAGPPPPAGFKNYENNAGGSGVISMITQIVNDAKAMEAEAIHDEEDAQKGYESFVQETNSSITTKNNSIVNKSSNRADEEEARIQREQEMQTSNNELDAFNNEKADLHTDCNYTLKNFDVRQDAFDQEVEALRQAKSILSGAKFGF